MLNKNLSGGLFTRALLKMNPWRAISNPVLLIVWLVSIIVTLTVIRQIYYKDPSAYLSAYTTLCLWLTLFFSSLAEAIVERKWHTTDGLDADRFISDRRVKTIKSLDSLDHIEKIAKKKIKPGSLILLDEGDTVLFDGKIVHGKGYINEVTKSGRISTVFKSVKGEERNLKAGSIIQTSEQLVMMVEPLNTQPFFSKISKRIKAIKRQSLPSEIALQRIILGLTILFILVIFNIAVIANYSGVRIPIVYMLDLVVILIPTTISALQRAIIIYGSGILRTHKVVIRDKMALENAIDVDIVILDKTGTLTKGYREIVACTPVVSTYSEQEIIRALYLVSVEDETLEGLSIKDFAGATFQRLGEKIDFSQYSSLPFSPSLPISSCVYKGLETSKGSVEEVANKLKLKREALPKKVLKLEEEIAQSYGTLMLLTINNEIVAVLQFKDKIRKNIKEQIEKLREEGIAMIMLTGDNSTVAGYFAKKLGIHAYYAQTRPEQKLDFIRDLQRHGHVVAMYGNDTSDVLALAQSDIGITFRDSSYDAINASNVIAEERDISTIVNLRDVCRQVTVKQGSLTVFSLASDITKFFIIVPALFTVAFPDLAALNVVNFYSVESLVLSSVMFNAFVILVLTPILLTSSSTASSRVVLWRNIILYGLGGILSPFIFIKIFDTLIHIIGLV